MGMALPPLKLVLAAIDVAVLFLVRGGRGGGAACLSVYTSCGGMQALAFFVLFGTPCLRCVFFLVTAL